MIFECMNSLVVTRIMGIFTDTVVPVVLLRQSSSSWGAPRKERHAFFAFNRFLTHQRWKVTRWMNIYTC